MPNIPSSPPVDALGRANPRIAPDEVWEKVREDYLSGMPGSEVCRRHGVGLTALRGRAKREGWRREDQPWTPPNHLDPDDEGVALEEQVYGDLDKVQLCQLSFVAWRRMMRAVMRGEAAAALRWHRVRVMLDVEQLDLERMVAQDEAVWQYLHGGREGGQADSADSTVPFSEDRTDRS